MQRLAPATHAPISPRLPAQTGAPKISDNASVSGSDAEHSSGDEAGVDAQNRKRKRTMKISCELCKARKVKCDKREPACSWCASHGRECIYKERKRPGVRTTYEVDLEEKVNRMEAMLNALGAKVDDHIASDQGARAVQEFQFSAAKFRSPSQTHGNWRHSPASFDDQPRPTPKLISEWHPTPPRPERSYSRTVDTVSIRSLVGDGESESQAGEGRYMGGQQASFDLPPEPESELPPYDLLYSLVDLYFKHVATWSPILDRKNTFDTLFGKSGIDEPDRILLHAIVAVTLRFSKDPRLTTSSRKRFHDVSKQKVQLYGLENPNIQALQALVILAIDILGTSNGPQGWNLLALIARNVVQLGLNVEKSVYLTGPSHPSISCLQAYAVSQPTSWTENEARRRLLWMIFVLDRYTTTSTTFNFTLDESEIDRPLPCSYDLFSQNEPVDTRWFRYPEKTEMLINNPDNLGSFAYHCEVLRILSRIHKFLNTPLDVASYNEVQAWRATYLDLDSDLNAFLAQLPGDYGRISQLCHSDPASKIANWIMLHAAFVTSVIRLHSAAAYPTVTSHLYTPSQQAMQRCLAAVDSLKAIAQDVVDSNGLDLLGPPFAFSLWVSARVLVVHAATLETDVDPKIGFFISTLDAMGRYWGVAEKYARILERLVSEGSNALVSFSAPGSGQHKTFTAMRRSAFELNHLVSQRPTSVLAPTSTRFTSLNELECLDVFNFFNYPRLPKWYDMNVQERSAQTPAASTIALFHDVRTTKFSPISADSDWLNYRSPT